MIIRNRMINEHLVNTSLASVYPYYMLAPESLMLLQTDVGRRLILLGLCGRKLQM